MNPTFELVEGDGTTNGPGIRCLVCGLTSWNPNDVHERYCGACCRFHDQQDSTAITLLRFVVDVLPAKCAVQADLDMRVPARVRFRARLQNGTRTGWSEWHDVGEEPIRVSWAALLAKEDETT